MIRAAIIGIVSLILAGACSIIDATDPAMAAGPKCGQWHDLARKTGWPDRDMATLDRLIWRESRCEPDAHNPRDPQTGSYGLTQINGFWCRSNRYEPNSAGFLGALGVVDHCHDLYDPETNLEAARWIFAYQALILGRCGFAPWRLPCR